jgi:hypothetical protein
MGSDASIYVFDSAVYLNEVVPFYRNLVRLGSVDDAFDEKWTNIRPFLPAISKYFAGTPESARPIKPTDLQRYCTYLGSDLRLIDQIKAAAVHANPRAEWETRACTRADCPASSTCPFHISDAAHQSNWLHWVFDGLTRAVCLGGSQFVGRSFSTSSYRNLVAESGAPGVGEMWQLLMHLGTRGFVVGYAFGNSDGVHGWLYPQEAGRLAGLLEQLQLPPVDASFDAMRRAHRDSMHSVDARGWAAMSLCFIKNVCAIAAADHKGVLWGNDLSDWLLD